MVCVRYVLFVVRMGYGGGEETQWVLTDESMKSWNVKFGVYGSNVHCWTGTANLKMGLL